MSNAPPTYDHAVKSDATSASTPGIAVTDAAGHPISSRPAAADRQVSHAGTAGGHDDETDDEFGDGFLHPHPAGGLHGDARKSFESMDEEYRELPEGWVRCFDPKTQHAFYAEEKTGRTTWLHPYDDPEYLRSLPDTHPANPNSAEAKAARAKYEEQRKLAGDRGATASTSREIRPPNHEKRHGVKGLTDKILGGNPDERRYKKEKRREQERASPDVGGANGGGGGAGPDPWGVDGGARSAHDPPAWPPLTIKGDLRARGQTGGRYAAMPSDPCNVQ